MCDRALMALNTVKNNYRKKVAVYDDTLRQHMLDEQILTEEMEEALKKGEFEVWFQPQVNYDKNVLIGAEALVRWRHPTRGLIQPADFIPLFEKNGFITKLDEYVLEKSCSYMRE
ncbi:Phytochrome-like protein cph2 [bioreactor metagenome]|uniref:Phytochrome-like protein cph2 n=1 Tax=bioreactor metagenome TaxID=1076179 RepID=A0A645GVB9_9ZZZZ